jgi:uncharacterized RDD family membrane protein YckC
MNNQFMKSAKITSLAPAERMFQSVIRRAGDPVAPIFNPLYRRISFCVRRATQEVFRGGEALPIRNRRYGRLKICATGFEVFSLVLAACFCLIQGLPAQDEPTPAAPAVEDQPAAKATSPEAEQALVEDTNKTAVIANGAEELDQGWRGAGNGVVWRPPMVVIGKDAELKAGESVEAVVVIGGSAKVHGRVREAVVVVGGDLDIDGQVGDAAVAVLGNITAHKGARVRGDAVAVGGRVDVAPGARVHSPQGVEFPDIRWLRKWFVQCVLLMRPLSLNVAWVWVVAAIFFLFYLLLASLFPRPVRACIDELTERPATTFCLGLLTILLFPLAIVILGVTGVGLLVVPFVLAALFFGALIGRVALLEWIGWRLAHQFGAQNMNNPLTGLLLGSVLIAALYLVPFLGLLTFAIISLWSLGGAVTAAFGGLRREMPEKTKPVVLAAAAPAMAAAGLSSAATQAGMAGTSGFETQAAPPIQATLPPSPIAPPVVPEILTYPKASFWERLGAAFLDVILVSILCAVLHPIAPLVALAYFSGLWAWRGTTVGGVVVGLKVVRVDGKPLSFPVTLVRSLAAAFSVLVLFLGFLWIAWDSEKQGWHDKIAGTVVLRLPRGTPLI